MSIAQNARRAVASMYSDAILAQSIPFNFGEGYGEKWDTIIPETSEYTMREIKDRLDDEGYLGQWPSVNPWEMDRDALIREMELEEFLENGEGVNSTNAELLDQLIEAMDEGAVDGKDQWEELLGQLFDDDSDSWHPMMNYAYPLPQYRGNAQKDQALLDKHAGPVCLVDIGGETFMALTGGGMDLTWEIIGGYMLLGYLPPLSFTMRPPDYANMEVEKTRWMIEGCRRTADIARTWADRCDQHMTHIESRLPKE